MSSDPDPLQLPQPGEALRALGHSLSDVERRVQVSDLRPEFSRRLRFSQALLEYGERPKSVRQIEWRGPRVTLVDCQRLPVTRLGQIKAAAVLMYVAEMPNRVRQLERIVFGAAEGDGFLVQRPGRIAGPGHARSAQGP
jgi:hypothetical protein